LAFGGEYYYYFTSVNKRESKIIYSHKIPTFYLSFIFCITNEIPIRLQIIS
jgi:hypothetical protein